MHWMFCPFHSRVILQINESEKHYLTYWGLKYDYKKPAEQKMVVSSTFKNILS